MSNTTILPNLKIVTAKDIAEQMGVSLNTAKSYYSDIKKEYDLKTKPTMYHLYKYFNIV